MPKTTHLNKYRKEDNIVQFISEAELDFHILDKFDSFEVEKMLNIFLEDCYLRKIENVTVIVGKGFVVRPYVQKLLTRHKLVEKFNQASFSNGQTGAFEVKLLSN